MFFHTGREFEIYSIGDGLYMQRVLNGVAAMSNDGILLQLVAFGLLIGLLIMGVRNVMAGGMKLEIGTFLAAFLLAVFLFGLRADVVVHDMSYVPGQKVQGDFTVANLPFGIAAIGSFVSTVGYTLTERMEQGYSIPAMAEMGMSRGGFGKILEWVNSIRLWEQPTAESPSSRDLSLFQRNLTAYIRECTLPGVDMGHICLESVRAAHDPLSMHTSNCTGGIGYGSHYRMVEFVTGFGGGGGSGGKDTSTYTCYEGHQVLLNNAGTGEAGFYKALGSVFPETVAAQSAQSTFAAAYESIGVASGHVQGVVLANAVGASLDRAMRSYEHRLSLTTLSEVMIEQASQQRLIQWAAEETMFRRIMRPMMAFFESLMYALAPFMALAVGLGTFGIATVFRYMMLTVWVSLWMPVLSIIQLFQITSVQHVVRALYDPMTGSDAMNPTSIAGAHLLRSEALEWMATGAALAAWTPAITMALVFSGAITASALAGKMQGQDTINEKLTAPDAVNAPPAIQRGSMGEFTEGAGGHKAGVSMPQFDMRNVLSNAESSVNSSEAAYAQHWQKSLSSAVSQLYNESDRRDASNALGLEGVVGHGQTGTVRDDADTSTTDSSGTANTHDRGNTLQSDVSAVQSKQFSGGIGLPGGRALPVNLRGQGTETNEQRDSAGQRQAWSAINKEGTDVANKEGSGWSVQEQRNRMLSQRATIQQAAAEGKQWAVALQNSMQQDSGLRASESRAASHRQSAENIRSSSVSRSENAAQAAERLLNTTSGAGQNLPQALAAAGRAKGAQAAYEVARAELSQHAHMTGDRLETASWLVAMSGGVDGHSNVRNSNIASLSERASALGDALDGKYDGVGGFSADSFNYGSNSEVSSGLPSSYGEARGQIGNPTAPNADQAALQAKMDGGPPPVTHMTPEQNVGNDGGPGDLDHGSARGAEALEQATVDAGEAARANRDAQGHFNVAMGITSSLESNRNDAHFGGGLNIYSREQGRPAFSQGTYGHQNSGKTEFDNIVAAYKEQVPDMPDSVATALAVRSMVAEGITTGANVIAAGNEAVASMDQRTHGIFLGYADSVGGSQRLEADGHLYRAGEGYSPDQIILGSTQGGPFRVHNQRRWESSDKFGSD